MNELKNRICICTFVIHVYIRVYIYIYIRCRGNRWPNFNSRDHVPRDVSSSGFFQIFSFYNRKGLKGRGVKSVYLYFSIEHPVHRNSLDRTTPWMQYSLCSEI